MSAPDPNLFKYEFVGLRDTLVAVPSSGSWRDYNRMSRARRFKEGRPVYMTDLGDIHAITYRIRHRPGKEEQCGSPTFEDDGQEVIVDIKSDTSTNHIMEFVFQHDSYGHISREAGFSFNPECEFIFYCLPIGFPGLFVLVKDLLDLFGGKVCYRSQLCDAFAQ